MRVVVIGTMLPTPDISHLKAEDYERVYEPAEDSFLLLDSLEREGAWLRDLRPSVCLEVGSGSGVVSTFLATQVLQPLSVFSLCTDINPHACSITARTARQNGAELNPVITDLASSLMPRLQGQVDVLLFNPPYVVTPPEEVGSQGIEASWAGGDRGREVIDRFLPLIPELLSSTGVCYLVIIKENDAQDIDCIMADYSVRMETVMQRRSGPEHLSVVKFTRRISESKSKSTKE